MFLSFSQDGNTHQYSSPLDASSYFFIVSFSSFWTFSNSVVFFLYFKKISNHRYYSFIKMYKYLVLSLCLLKTSFLKKKITLWVTSRWKVYCVHAFTSTLWNVTKVAVKVCFKRQNPMQDRERRKAQAGQYMMNDNLFSIPLKKSKL